MTKPKNNFFDLSHEVKLSCNAGQLVPCFLKDCLPGSRWKIGCESLVRLAPLIAPLMHRVHVTVHYFFVPNRILWPNWEKFITNDPAVAFPFLKMEDGAFTPLCDYLGVPDPTGLPGLEIISALPFAAYQKIYDEYYRDQNLVTSNWAPLVDGDNAATEDILKTLRIRAWMHDYFTSALPFAQKGAAVDIPLGEIQLKSGWEATAAKPFFDNVGSPSAGDITQSLTGGAHLEVTGDSDKVAYDPQGTLESEATTINDLRRAFRLQEWLEKAARGGTRYVESILAHFGVKSSDKRLQRPEYITGIKTPIKISEVLNTTGTEDAPQGSMAGHGVSFTQGNYGSYFCEEHGYIMGIMSITPKTAYQQGLPKHFSKMDVLDFGWPAFAHIGEQEVLNREVFAYQGDPSDDTFGYVPRYAEYKFENDRVAGQFRTSLDFWHWGRIFATAPALNQEFIECNPEYRPFAVEDPDVDHFWIHHYNDIKAWLPLPKFGTPTF